VALLRHLDEIRITTLFADTHAGGFSSGRGRGRGGGGGSRFGGRDVRASGGGGGFGGSSGGGFGGGRGASSVCVRRADIPGGGFGGQSSFGARPPMVRLRFVATLLTRTGSARQLWRLHDGRRTAELGASTADLGLADIAQW